MFEYKNVKFIRIGNDLINLDNVNIIRGQNNSSVTEVYFSGESVEINCSIDEIVGLIGGVQ